MTYNNCLKFLKEAKDEETKNFWADRIARKYPESVKKPEPVVEKPKKKEKKKNDDK